MALRPFPTEARRPGTTKAFVETYRAAFDADPAATFCAGEVDGITLVVARGYAGLKLQQFVMDTLDGEIQRPSKRGAEPAEQASTAAKDS